VSAYSEIRKQITQKADFGQFIENELGLTVSWNGTFETGMCVCPLHGDTLPSFSVSKVDGVWLFHCFGCQESGTIIEFFMQYYDLRNIKNAMELICDKFDIHESLDSIGDSFADVDISGTFNIKKKTLGAHVVTANRCRLLIRCNNVKEVADWVSAKYRELNQALRENDFTRIEEIEDEASCVTIENLTR